MRHLAWIAAIAAFSLLSSAASAQEPAARYGMKSGIVETVTTIMKLEVKTVTYFDDYGALEASDVSMPSPLGDVEVTTISRDGKSYVVEKKSKKVQEVPVQESTNYLDLTDSVREKFQIKEVGSEEVEGRQCTVYSEVIDYQGRKSNAKVWVWKGIPLRTEVSALGMKITSMVVGITEDAAIPPEVFEVPSF